MSDDFVEIRQYSDVFFVLFLFFFLEKKTKINESNKKLDNDQLSSCDLVRIYTRVEIIKRTTRTGATHIRESANGRERENKSENENDPFNNKKVRVDLS